MTTAKLHRTTVDIDVTAFERARTLLGTKGYRDTVNGALKEIDRMDRLRQAADLVRGGGLDVVSPEELAELREARQGQP